jgi:hypothetical protein
MRVINCPRCSGKLQVAPDQYLYGATRPCPLCGTLIQLASEHRPLPPHRLRGTQSAEPWGAAIFAAAVLGIALLCLVAAAVFQWSGSSGGTSATAGRGATLSASVLQSDRNGFKARIRNDSGVAVSRVAIDVRVVESGTPTPIIQRVYHLESAVGIEGGNSVDFQVDWETQDSKAFAMAKRRLTTSLEASALTAAGSDSPSPNVP